MIVNTEPGMIDITNRHIYQYLGVWPSVGMFCSTAAWFPTIVLGLQLEDN